MYKRQRLPCPVFGSADLKRNYPQIGQIRQISEPELIVPFWSGGFLQSAESAQSADHIAFLQHSSGTTGLQKGVALSHAAVLNQVAAYSDALWLREDDVVVSWLPLYHDMGLIAGFLLPLIQGIPLVLISPFDWVQHLSLIHI